MSRRAESRGGNRPVRGASGPGSAAARSREAGSIRSSGPAREAIRETPALSALASALFGVVFGVIYLVLAPPVSGPKDASEFTLVLAFGGAAHPTGYPIYVMLGHVFVTVLHRLGATWPYAANAWSAVGGGVAIAMLHALAARVIPPRAPLGRVGRFALASLAAGIFGASPIWLLDAMLAEVYTWHMVWVCGVSLFTLAAIRLLPERELAPARVTRGAIAWGLLGGLGAAHHVTAVLVYAPLSVALLVALVRARRPVVAPLALAVVCTLPPLSAYGFIAWRAFHPAPYQWQLLQPSWSSVFAHVRGAAYGDLIGKFAPDDVQSGLLRAYCWPVLFPALALSLVAPFRARGPERLARAAFLAAAVCQTLYAFDYGVLDPSCYFEPAMALGLLAVPVLGADLLGSRRVAPLAAPHGQRLVLAGAELAVAVLASVWLPTAASIRAGTIEVDRRMRTMWNSIPPGPGFLLWDHDMVSTFAIYQKLEGRRPDLFAGSPAALSWPGPRLAFERRYGFDPLQGLTPLTTARAAEIPANISRQTPLPVRVFELENQRVVEVPKQWPEAAAAR